MSGAEDEARRALADMLRRLDAEIGRVIEEQRARGEAPGASAVLALDAESPVMLEAGGADLFARFPRVAGHYIVAGAPVEMAASIARLFADAAGTDPAAAEGEVRRIAGGGHTVVLAQTGMACAAVAFRLVSLSPGGQA